MYPATTPERIASLSACVTELSEEDGVARAILERETDGLLRVLDALYKRIGCDSFRVGLYGGIFSAPEIFDLFVKKAGKKYCQLVFHILTDHAAAGALKLALAEMEGC